jgi:hypothetical protein
MSDAETRNGTMRQDRTKKLAWVFTLALTGAAALPAAAQPTAVPRTQALSPEQRQQADEFFRNGSRLYTQQKWAEAEAAFLAAWALNPTYDVAANLGHTEYQLGKYRDASEHLAFALHSWPIVGKRDPRELVQKRLAEARKQVGAVTIRVSRPGADVFVDGKQVGRSPIEQEVFVEPGGRTIEAKLAGFEDARQRIEASKGGEFSVTLALGASGGQGAGPGETATATPRGAAPPGLPPPPPSPVATGPRKEVLIAGGVTAGAALIAGVVFAAMSSSKAADADERMTKLRQLNDPDPCRLHAGDCDAIEASRGAHDMLANGALVGFVGAGMLAASTVAYGLLAHPARPAARVRVLPMLTVGQAGAAVRGAW